MKTLKAKWRPTVHATYRLNETRKSIFANWHWFESSIFKSSEAVIIHFKVSKRILWIESRIGSRWFGGKWSICKIELQYVRDAIIIIIIKIRLIGTSITSWKFSVVDRLLSSHVRQLVGAAWNNFACPEKLELIPWITFKRALHYSGRAKERFWNPPLKTYGKCSIR